MQLLLLPDPRPLVDQLGPEFFRNSPESPGVYLMKDAANEVLYVGKAKNLRKRLGSYRVANPDRMPRRHLKMLRKVVSIQCESCADEAAALARESALLLEIRPRFNRAGTWRPPKKFLVWKTESGAVTLTVCDIPEAGACSYGPMGSGRAKILHQALAVAVWSLLNPSRPAADAPHGIFKAYRKTNEICLRASALDKKCTLPEVTGMLERLLNSGATELLDLVRHSNDGRARFDVALIDSALETIAELLAATPSAPHPSEAGPEIR